MQITHSPLLCSIISKEPLTIKFADYLGAVRIHSSIWTIIYGSGPHVLDHMPLCTPLFAYYEYFMCIIAIRIKKKNNKLILYTNYKEKKKYAHSGF